MNSDAMAVFKCVPYALTQTSPLCSKIEGKWIFPADEGEGKKVEYTFNVTSNKAITFDEIAKELNQHNQVLLVSVNELQSEAEKKAIKVRCKALRELRENTDDHCQYKAVSTEISQISKTASEFYILIEPKLATKIYTLGSLGDAHAVGLVDLLMESVQSSSVVDMMQVSCNNISEVKKSLQHVKDASWGTGYKASVEVKCLL